MYGMNHPMGGPGPSAPGMWPQMHGGMGGPATVSLGSSSCSGSGSRPGSSAPTTVPPEELQDDDEEEEYSAFVSKGLWAAIVRAQL